MRIPADMSSVRGSKRTFRGMSRATALCTALYNIVLLVANAKQIADNYMKVTIVYTQIREGYTNLERCCERTVLCRNKNVVTDQID